LPIQEIIWEYFGSTQGGLKVTLDTKKSGWLDMVETLSVIGSIGGSIASVAFQQVGFASIPLSLSITLNLVNRRRLLDTISQGNHTAIAELTQNNVETQAKLGTLTQQLADLRQLTSGVQQHTSNLQEDSTQLLSEQKKIAEVVDCLQEIETCTQAIRINPNDAQAYYNRGLSYQRLGNKEGAIGDYTEAIQLNSHHAKAYQDRGLICAELGDKKRAVRDLREAAKLFFEEGDIANYQTAKEFSQKFHELNSQPGADAPQAVAVESLFA
jgi:tetratricopeptide (TPR) repeat protein